MASRIAARKTARFISLNPRLETVFNPRSKIPISSENIAHSRWGCYRAELISIDPVANSAHTVGGPPEREMYAWTYRTLKSRDNVFLEEGIDSDGKQYEFLHYTNTILGDPISSLTVHVRELLGESPDPEVWEKLGLLRLVGSVAIIRIEFGKFVIPSRNESLDWYGEGDHTRRGQHMTGITRTLVKLPCPSPVLLQAIAGARLALAEEQKPIEKPKVAHLNITAA